jgi:hypothetical protein
MAAQRVKVRALARLSSSIFGSWGLAVLVKAVYDLFAGEPEANLYSPAKWDFVTREQWLRYGGFELAYALACLGAAWALWKYSGLLPETAERRTV